MLVIFVTNSNLDSLLVYLNIYRRGRIKFFLQKLPSKTKKKLFKLQRKFGHISSKYN
jgi:hypothetical protein